MSQPQFIEKILAKLASWISTPEQRRKLVGRLLGAGRAVLWVVSLLYLIPLLILCIGIHWRAEHHLALAFMAFLPSQLWILPAIPLLICSLPFSLRLSALHAAVIVIYFFGFMDYQGAPASVPAGSDHLTVLSYNRGQHANQSLQPFKNLVEPDLLALQEATGRAAGYARSEAYDEFVSFEGIGEFVLLSKYPIVDKRLILVEAFNRQQNLAARFEIEYLGGQIAVYLVHLPTPRDVLNYYKRGAVLYGVLGFPGTPWGKKRVENQKYWDERIRIAKDLLALLEKEPLPFLVVGDFNMPDHGYIYHLFARAFTDAHEEAGGGFGFTFPGVTRNPLSGGQPWLRIDYAFASDHWDAVSFTTEKHRPSQHRAIAAGFRLKDQFRGQSTGVAGAAESGLQEAASR